MKCGVAPNGRGALRARRDDREYIGKYLSEEKRRQRGSIARRMQSDFHHGLLASVLTQKFAEKLQTIAAAEGRAQIPLNPPFFKGGISSVVLKTLFGKEGRGGFWRNGAGIM